MKLNQQTVMSYENFDDLSKKVIELAREIMPDKVIYVNFLNEDVQITMKVSQNNTLVKVDEGVTIDIADAICNQIDFDKGKPLILEDIKNNQFDPRVKKTIEDLNIGSYLGIPIKYQDGMRFGALCAAHHDKSQFDQKDINLLESIAKLFSYYLVLEHIAYQDALTKLYNKRFLEIKNNEILNNNGLLLMLDLDNFKAVNDTFGHDTGDLVLKEVASKLKSFISKYQDAFAIRLGGDEFIVYINNNFERDEVLNLLNKLNKQLNNWETNIGNIYLSTSIGAIITKAGKESDLSEVLKEVDNLMYQAKKNGKNTYVLL